MGKIKNIVLFLAVAAGLLGVVSCEKEIVDDQAKAKLIVEKYGSGNSELSKLYDYAVKENDQDILFLMANMEGKYSKRDQWPDVYGINADSVIASVKHSRKVWSELPWAADYSDEQFREYVLPYKMGYEPLEYYWKEDAYSRYYISPEEKEEIAEYAKRYNSGTGFQVNMSDENKDYSYSALSKAKEGTCADWSLFCILGLRAAGIPAAELLIVYWGDFNNSHSMPGLVFPDETSLRFESPYLAENTVDKATPKIYRRMFSIQDDTPIYKYREKESIPEVFSRHDLKDVTDKYPMHTRDIEVTIPRSFKNDSRIVYLGVFAREKWFPVAYVEKKGRKALFPYVGTGHQNSGEFVANGHNIGEGIIYLPMYYVDNKEVPAGPVMVVGKDENRILDPDTLNTQTLVLNRKYPCKTNTIYHFHDMINATFEASDNLKSEKWDKLHKVYMPPRSRVQQVPVEENKKYKYARVRMPKGRLSLAHLKFYDQQGQEIKGRLISDEYVPYYGELESMTDGDPLTYITTEDTFDVWLGMEFEKPEQISMIEYWPRNDDNDVWVGDTYELLYWDREWKSLGQQVADSHELNYENVPTNALFWLRNRTKGKEERPFTYENGTQVWW